METKNLEKLENLKNFEVIDFNYDLKEIISVKRLQDNEIFSLGDTIKSPFEKCNFIEEFFVVGNQLHVKGNKDLRIYFSVEGMEKDYIK